MVKQSQTNLQEHMRTIFFVCCFFITIGTCTPLHSQASLPPDSSLWALQLHDVIVTAQYAPTDSRNAVHDVITIREEVIEQRGATNLEQLLLQEANIRIRQDMVLGSSMSLLGIDGQNVKIMVDGVPVIGRQDGNIDLSQLNLNNIERVEIVEGPMSVSYGTDALGGVINLITKKSQLDRYDLNLTSQVEVRGENRYAAAFGAHLTDDLTLRLNGGYDVFGGFSENDSLRSVLWNPKEQWFADAYLGYRLDDKRKLFYTGSFFDEEVQNLGNIRRPQFKPYAFDDFYLNRRINHSLAYEGQIGKDYYLQATTGYNQFRRYKRTLRRNFEENEQLEVPGMQDTARFSGAMLRATFASQYADSPLNFQVGVDLHYDDATGQRIQDSLSNREGFSQIGDYAAFGSLRYQAWEALTAEAGLRYAYNTRYEAPLVPSFHLKYRLNEQWALRGSYSQGFRSPDLKELFFEFIDINHFILGNPNLRAERSDNMQLGLFYEQRGDEWRLKGKIKGFYNDIRDKIELFEYIETDEGIAPAIDTSTLRFAYFNQAVYKTQGVNFSLSYSTPRLELSANASTIGYYNPASEDLPQLDEFTYAMEYSGSATYRWLKAGFSASLFVRVNDRQVNFFPTTDAEGNTIAGQRIQDGFTMADFTLTKSFWKERIDLTLGARNLLDVRRANIQGAASGGAHSGSTGSAPVSPGRNVFVRMMVDLGW